MRRGEIRATKLWQRAQTSTGDLHKNLGTYPHADRGDVASRFNTDLGEPDDTSGAGIRLSDPP
jgi:hypothetical protein